MMDSMVFTGIRKQFFKTGRFENHTISLRPTTHIVCYIVKTKVAWTDTKNIKSVSYNWALIFELFYVSCLIKKLPLVEILTEGKTWICMPEAHLFLFPNNWISQNIHCVYIFFAFFPCPVSFTKTFVFQLPLEDSHRRRALLIIHPFEGSKRRVQEYTKNRASIGWCAASYAS